MTDKVQKIRKEVEKRYEYWKEKESNFHSIESEIRMSECQHLLLMLDSLQEEPVSEDLEEEIELQIRNLQGVHAIENGQNWWKGTYEELEEFARHFAEWQKVQDTNTSNQNP